MRKKLLFYPVNCSWISRYLIFILFLIIILSLSGCFILIDISDSPFGYAGRWRGMPLYDRGMNYKTDKPEYMFFLHINQIGENIFGVLSRVDSYGFSEGPITGKQQEQEIAFKAKFHHETITFQGWWVNNQKAWVGKWENDLGQSGEAFFELQKKTSDQTKGIWSLKNQLIFKGGDGKPVIFIHGMNSTGSKWNDLLNQLKNKGYYDDHQVWVFQYNWADSIAKNGLDLYNKILEAGIQNPIIVAHSMGGLVARSYVAQGGMIEKLVTFGTPHLGTPLADLGAKLLGSNNFSTWLQTKLMPGVADMKETSSFITDLNMNQNDQNNRSKYIVVASAMNGQPFYLNVCQGENCLPKVIWKWTREDYSDWVSIVCFCMIPGENDGYVPENSALFQGGRILSKNQYFLNGWLEHTQIINPEISPEIVSILINL